MPIFCWTPPTTPICLKCLKFSPSWLCGEKKPPQSRDLPGKLQHWKCRSKLFYGLLYMLAVCHFIFGQISNVKVFTGTVNVGTPPVQWVFWNLNKKWKWSVLRRKKNFPVNFKKRHESLGKPSFKKKIYFAKKFHKRGGWGSSGFHTSIFFLQYNVKTPKYSPQKNKLS